jgi:hypothetical protein
MDRSERQPNGKFSDRLLRLLGFRPAIEIRHIRTTIGNVPPALSPIAAIKIILMGTTRPISIFT